MINIDNFNDTGGNKKSCTIFGSTPPLCRQHLVRLIRGTMASTGLCWMPLNHAKRVWLADDDPALSPAKLKARLKERAKAARKKERNKLALGLPG